MKIVCCYCKRLMGEKEGDQLEETHGVCCTCKIARAMADHAEIVKAACQDLLCAQALTMRQIEGSVLKETEARERLVRHLGSLSKACTAFRAAVEDGSWGKI